MSVRYRCKKFLGNRPCFPHKMRNKNCVGCDEYEPTAQNILIIKLAAQGDVIRTTSILPIVKEVFPHSRIFWLTQSHSAEILKRNPFIDKTVSIDTEELELVKAIHFDIVYSLDNDWVACAVASIVHAKSRVGFSFHPDGHVDVFNGEARHWFLMSLDDALKKNNRNTFLEHLCTFACLPYRRILPQFPLKNDEIEFARKTVSGLATPSAILIGLNTGAGSTWKKKKWPADYYIELIRLLKQHYGKGVVVLLLGGQREFENNRRIAAASECVTTPHDMDLGRFAALLARCQLIVTGDTLAMHLAVSQKVKTVALFGPTSATEIDLFDRGTKLVSSIGCQSCYLPDCDKNPYCMELITAKDVFEQIRKLL